LRATAALRRQACPVRAAVPPTPPKPRTSARPHANRCPDAWSVWSPSITSSPIESARFHALRVGRVAPDVAGSAAITLQVPPTLQPIFDFQPGQFLTLRAEVDGALLRRSYSICSPTQRLRTDGEIDIGIKPVAGGRIIEAFLVVSLM